MEGEFLEHAGIFLILGFLLITMASSAYEKLYQWQETLDFYQDEFKNVLPKSLTRVLIILIIVFEIINTSLLATSFYEILYLSNFRITKIALTAVGILLLVFLIGLRLIKDYSGATRLGIYLLIAIFGLSLLP